MRHPHVLQLVMDSLRYWVDEMHVDGFRFDLAATLARELHDVDKLSAFFDIIQQDPVVSQVKLIAEPWDVGEGGYQVGNFPPLGRSGTASTATRCGTTGGAPITPWPSSATGFTGSSDLYESNGRTPSASINFVTAHDGFTLADLVSFEAKHNEANGEDNHDGTDDNRSWNCGAEGPTDDPGVSALRRQQQRNFLVTLLLSQGVPMLLGGDEIGRTQGGNDNAYAQDNEVSWYDWAAADEALVEFTSRLTSLRHDHPVFRRRKWFQGRPIMGEQADDIGWFTPDGAPMTVDDWNVSYAKSLGVFLNGDGIAALGNRGQHVVDDSFYVAFNAFEEPMEFVLPTGPYAQHWGIVVDTAHDDVDQAVPAEATQLAAGDSVKVAGRAVVVLRAISAD